MKRQRIVGVMGGGNVAPKIAEQAYLLGSLIAKSGWILLNGGRNAGVMDASARGAADHGGVTVGVLPDAETSQASDHIQIPICTGMGSARNTINILSSDIVVACYGSHGTLSEVALALKHGKTVITMGYDTLNLFHESQTDGTLVKTTTPEEAIEQIDLFLSKSS